MPAFGEKMKWVYAFIAIASLLAWGLFSQIQNDIITGFLITANTLIVQYYFRKKTPDEPAK